MTYHSPSDCFWPIRNNPNSAKVITTAPPPPSKIHGYATQFFFSFWKEDVHARAISSTRSHDYGEIFPQVNRSPSFGTDTKLDSEIKGGALCDALKLLNIRYFFTSVVMMKARLRTCSRRHETRSSDVGISV